VNRIYTSLVITNGTKNNQTLGKPEGEVYRMDNPETLATLVTQDTVPI